MKPVSRLPTNYETFYAVYERRKERVVAWVVVMAGVALLIFACVMRSV